MIWLSSHVHVTPKQTPGLIKYIYETMYKQNINGIELAGRARNVCVCVCVWGGGCTHVGACVLADVSLFPLLSLDREGEGRIHDVLV